jgi:hypothetical protein
VIFNDFFVTDPSNNKPAIYDVVMNYFEWQN